MKRNKIEKKGSYPIGSEYESGKTSLDREQVGLLEQFSEVIHGHKNNYENLHNSYTPKSILALLEDQIVMRIREGELSNSEIDKGKAILHELNKSFSYL
ncbi:hypothetical protein ACIQLG_16745 [Terribacillus saccharophilus]|uniref:hypothetical protein n=1 Tax=Terribacillus saccharophilus TaxID=361277 RepID=UPI0038192893